MVAAGSGGWTSAHYTDWTLRELTRLLQVRGSSVWAYYISAALYHEDPCHWEVVNASAGLQKFVMASKSLEWVPGSGTGQETIKIKASGGKEKVSHLAVKSKASGRKERIPRLAGAFAGYVGEWFGETATVTRAELAEAFSWFCEEEGETESGFGSVLYRLVGWRVVLRVGSDTFMLAGKAAPHFKKRVPAPHEGALEGEPPRLLELTFSSPVPVYGLPKEFSRLAALDVYKMQAATRRLLSEEKGLSEIEGITAKNYKDYQHAVLFAEELQMTYDIALYDLELQEPLKFKAGLHTIFVPGLAEKRPSVLKGDQVLIRCKQGRFKGWVHQVSLESIQVSFHTSFSNKPPFSVHFSFNRTPLRTMHRAVDEFSDALLAPTEVQRPDPEPHPLLNEEQRQFLSAARQPGGRGPALPLLLWGPPGTGKTTTVVHTIVSILRKQSSSKILVTAPSNPAADLLCERLAKQNVRSDEMLRLVAVGRDPRQVPEAVKKFTRPGGGAEYFVVPPLEALGQQRVVVATCTASAYIRSSLRELKDRWFTHVFVDEAAQAMEAEVLVPLTQRAQGGRIFLAGDFKQLGPVIRSPVAISYGLHVPLMDRIQKAIGISHSRICTLLDTYRAHPSILSLYNKTVYGDVLKCCSPKSSYDMEGWEECPRGKDGARHPVIFHHCDGQEKRSADSPSWQNVEEVDVVKRYLMKLLAYGVKAEDVGIISPYHKQCQRLRYMCLGEDANAEVGTTELFQGREKRVIIISTVRSRQEEEIKSDFRFTLGFLGNFKRTNVALSRARSLLIVVGNMKLLSNDATWHNVIKLAREKGGARGPAFALSRPIYGENSEWTGNSGGSGTQEGGFGGAMDRPWRDHV